MKQWLTLFNKEWLEMSRNYKIIWIPAVFALLGITQPISTYYMPQLIEEFGELPEGAVISIPTPPAWEVVASTLSQFTQIGLLVLVLASMGIVAGERVRGTAAIILAKPVSRASFITAKWATVLLVTWLAYTIGFAGGAYYTMVLFDEVSGKNLLLGFAVYGIYLTFVMTLTLFLSTLMKNTGMVAFLSLGGTLLLSIISGIFQKGFTWSPTGLTAQANAFLRTGAPDDHFGVTLVVTISLVMLLLSFSIHFFKRKELN